MKRRRQATPPMSELEYQQQLNQMFAQTNAAIDALLASVATPPREQVPLLVPVDQPTYTELRRLARELATAQEQACTALADELNRRKAENGRESDTPQRQRNT